MAEQASFDIISHQKSPEEIAREAHTRRVNFLQRQLVEGPSRKPPMPDVQMITHRGELNNHLAALGVSNVTEIIPVNPETQDTLVA